MNIFTIAFLILLYTKSSVECGTTYHHYSRIPRHSLHNSQKKLSAKVTLSEESIKSSQETNKSNTSHQDFPCNTFICLFEKFDVMKTPNGFVLNKSPSPPVNDRCSNLVCWLNRFKIKQTSYGYELTDKAVMQESTLSTIDRPRSTTPIISSTESTIAPTTTDESLQDFDQWFDDYLY